MEVERLSQAYRASTKQRASPPETCAGIPFLQLGARRFQEVGIFRFAVVQTLLDALEDSPTSTPALKPQARARQSCRLTHISISRRVVNQGI